MGSLKPDRLVRPADHELNNLYCRPLCLPEQFSGQPLAVLPRTSRDLVRHVNNVRAIVANSVIQADDGPNLVAKIANRDHPAS